MDVFRFHPFPFKVDTSYFWDYVNCLLFVTWSRALTAPQVGEMRNTVNVKRNFGLLLSHNYVSPAFIIALKLG